MLAWETFLDKQEGELGKETVDQWLRSFTVLRFDAGNLYLEAQDSFQATWFEEHIRQKVLSSLVNNNNRKIKVHLSVAHQPEPVPKAAGKDKARFSQESPGFAHSAFELAFDTLDPSCTLDNFIFSGDNLLVQNIVLEALANISAAPSATAPLYNPIYIYGGKGTGKTHLLMGITAALRSKGLNVVYTRTETFTEHVVTAIKAGEMGTFRHAYRNADALVIDDAHVFSRKGATQEELFHTFNTLHLNNKQIILSAHCAPQFLQHIEPRLVSRFEWGIAASMEALKGPEIARMLALKAAALHFELTPNVADFLKATFNSSSKSLIRALEALVLRSHLQKSEHKNRQVMPVGSHLGAIRELLADLMAEEQKNVITPEKVIQCVAECYGIRSVDILGKGQGRDSSLPRQMAMFLCRHKLKLPFMKIGDVFSRDHSTVMSSVRQVQKWIAESNAEVVSSLLVIEKSLQA